MYKKRTELDNAIYFDESSTFMNVDLPTVCENMDVDLKDLWETPKFEINEKFEHFLNIVTNIESHLDLKLFRKLKNSVAHIWELVKILFKEIDLNLLDKLNKLKLQEKKSQLYQQKFRISQAKLNKCVKFIDFVKRNEKSVEIEKYLKENNISKFGKVKFDHKSKIDNETKIYNDSERRNTAEYQDQLFYQDVETITEYDEEFLDNKTEPISQTSKTIFLMITPVAPIDNLKVDDKKNSDTNIFSSSNNCDSENESEPSYEKDDELFKIIPEQYKYKKCFTKLENGHYQCNICQKISPNYCGFAQHSISHEEQTLICEICGKLFENHQKCRHHVGKCRKNRKVVKQKPKSESMHVGIDYKSISSTVHCPLKTCNRRFVEKDYSYHEHLDFHRGIKPYLCNTCAREFQFAFNLFTHLNSKSRCCLENCTLPDYAPDVKNYDEFIDLSTFHYKYGCETCGRKFITQFKLLEHQNSHTKAKPYICSCGISYNTFNYLSCHWKKFNCNRDLSILPDYCASSRFKKQLMPSSGKNNSTPVTKTVKEKKKYLCLDCEVEFDFGCSKKLIRHRQLYHLERKIECDECKKKFPTLPTLREHKRKIHIGTYKCDMCESEKLMSYSQYYSHKLNYHNKNNLGAYECRVCALEFKFNSDLIDHINNAGHTCIRKKPQFCLICNEKLRYFDFLRHFNKSHHKELELNWRRKSNINNLICCYCDEKMEEVGEYVRHLDVIHHELNLRNHLERLLN